MREERQVVLQAAVATWRASLVSLSGPLLQVHQSYFAAIMDRRLIPSSNLIHLNSPTQFWLELAVRSQNREAVWSDQKNTDEVTFVEVARGREGFGISKWTDSMIVSKTWRKPPKRGFEAKSDTLPNLCLLLLKAQIHQRSFLASSPGMM